MSNRTPLLVVGLFVNSGRLRILFVATVLIGMLAFGGCAQMAVNRALKKYQEQLDPAIGRMKKHDYIKAWGPPQSTTAVSDGEVCVWHFSYGTRAVAGGSQYFVNARAHEMYDKLTMVFDKFGVLDTWRAHCQR